MMDTSMIVSLGEWGSCRRHASGMARTPAGRIPAAPPAIWSLKKEGVRGTVPRTGAGSGPLAQR